MVMWWAAGGLLRVSCSADSERDIRLEMERANTIARRFKQIRGVVPVLGRALPHLASRLF